MSQEIELTGVIPASPEKVYRAWLDEAEHTAFTGQKASVDPNVGGEFSTGDGYCQGRNLELEPNSRIVQTWRSTEFPDDSPDSRVELVFEATDEGTRLTLRHTDIPEGQADSLRQGWNEFYFEPLSRYFNDDLTDPGADEESDTDGVNDDEEDEVSHGRDDVETVVTAPMYAGEAAVTAPPAGRSARKAFAKGKPPTKKAALKTAAAPSRKGAPTKKAQKPALKTKPAAKKVASAKKAKPVSKSRKPALKAASAKKAKPAAKKKGGSKNPAAKKKKSKR